MVGASQEKAAFGWPDLEQRDRGRILTHHLCLLLSLWSCLYLHALSPTKTFGMHAYLLHSSPLLPKLFFSRTSCPSAPSTWLCQYVSFWPIEVRHLQIRMGFIKIWRSVKKHLPGHSFLLQHKSRNLIYFALLQRTLRIWQGGKRLMQTSRWSNCLLIHSHAGRQHLSLYKAYHAGREQTWPEGSDGGGIWELSDSISPGCTPPCVHHLRKRG